MQIDKRTFFYHAAIMATSNIGLQLLGFAYRIALSRLAGAEGLGVYRLVFSAYTVVNAACLAGVTLACSRLGAYKMAQGKPEQLRMLMHAAIGLFLLLFTACTALIVPFHDFIAGTLLGDLRTAQALPIMLICLFLTGFENIIKALFIGIGSVQYAAMSETGEQVIRITVVIGLLIAFGGQDYARIAALIMLGMAISECFSVTFLGFMYHRHIGTLGKGKELRHDKGMLRQMIEIALPLSIAAVIGNSIASASAVILPQRLVVSGLSGSEAMRALGVISGMAMPLLLLPIALISAVGTVLLPSITAAQARGDRRRVRALTDKALTVTGLIGLPATAGLIPLAPSLSRLFFGQTLPPLYVFLLGAGAVLTYYEIITASLLNGVGAQRRAVTAAVCGETVQLALTWVLAAKPALGIYGYLLAMVISPIFVIAANLWGLRIKTGLHFRVWHIFGIPLVCGLVVFLWTRVFYSFFLGVVGAQWCALLLTLSCAAALDILLLRLLGVHVTEYIAQHVRPSRTMRMFGFI